MALTLEDIAERRERVQMRAERAQADYRAAQAELAALDVLEQSLKEELAPAPSLTLPGIDPNPPAEATSVPFAQAVRDAVRTLKGIEFTVVDVEEVLRRTHRPLPVNKLRTRITLELTPLRQKGVIVLTHAGMGNAPNRYRLAEEGIKKGEGAWAAPSFYN